MSWLFSQVLVEEYLGDTCLDGEPSALSSGNSTQQAYCVPGKMTDFSRLSRFGMTFKPLTESLGEELLMSYQAGFHAKTLAQPEKAVELKAKEVECGNKWQELLAKLDLNTLLWKTAQCSLLEDLELSLQTWPKWGSMRNGECYRQPMLAQITLESECGSLPRIPTPDANMGKRGTQENWLPIRPSGQPAQYPINQYLRDLTKITGKPNPMWCEWLMGWPMQWTDLKPLETGKFPYVQQQPGNY
jgi:hypothetical protein